MNFVSDLTHLLITLVGQHGPARIILGGIGKPLERIVGEERNVSIVTRHCGEVHIASRDSQTRHAFDSLVSPRSPGVDTKTAVE